MNIILWYECFEQTGMQCITNGPYIRKFREVYSDILIFSVALQNFEGACTFCRTVGQLELLCCKVLGGEHELISCRMVLT